MKTKTTRFGKLSIHDDERTNTIYVFSYAALIYEIKKDTNIVIYDPIYLYYGPTTTRHFTKALNKLFDINISINDLRKFYDEYNKNGTITEYKGLHFQPC